jgi:uncharacterized protein YgiM (DUF1202 family)
MKHSSKYYLIGAFILTLTVALLFGCATKGKTTQPEGTAEQAKPASEPAGKAPESTLSPPPPAKTTPTPPPSSPPPSKPSEVSQPSGQRTTEIVLAFVNLRQEPSMEGKIIRVLKKGTRLIILEEKAGWLRVRLEDGTEGWVGKAMTSAGTPPKSP